MLASLEIEATKPTEFGPIPCDWEILEAFDLRPFITSGSRGWARYYSDFGAPFIRITNLSHDDIFPDLTDLRHVSVSEDDPEALRTRLEIGDVLISITADIGAIGYVGANIPSPAYINQHIACLRLPSELMDGRFAAYFLTSLGPQRRFATLIDVGAKSGLNLTTIGRLKLLVPPLKEQHAIAAALSDTDGLIEALESLIAKKRAVKQGAMQELLSGRTRLPGFSGQWLLKRLDELSAMKSGNAITSADIDQFSRFPCYGGNGLRGYTSRFTHDGEYALVGRQGALCGNVYFVQGQFFASEHAIVVTANARTEIRWLTYALVRMKLNQYSESSAQPGLSVTKILKLEMPTPPTREEQQAIAAAISDMDDELAALETRLAKARAIKQGMMQELLTGRIRLL